MSWNKEDVVEVALSQGIAVSMSVFNVSRDYVVKCVEEFDSTMTIDYCECEEHMKKHGGIMQCAFCTKGRFFSYRNYGK